MDKLSPIKIPLLNANEPEALLVSLEYSEGELVKQDQVVAVIETTKSTGEILAEKTGYLVGLRYMEGETLPAGEILAYIGETPDAQDPALPPWGGQDTLQPEGIFKPNGLRITTPARELAHASGLDLSSLPHGPLITRQMIEQRLPGQISPQPQPIPAGEKRILIYGAGGHGRSLAAMIRKLGNYEIIGFLDDGYPPGEQVFGLTILGGSEKLPELAQDGVRLAVNAIGGISDLQVRLKVYDLLHQAGFFCPTVIHPTAFLENSTSLGDAIQVFPFAYVGTEVAINYGCIINTGVIISHNCELAPFVNLSPGATLAGGVNVGEKTLIGMRATINLNVHIGKAARIGNGATVKADVPDRGVVPAGSIWPPRR
ncbi:MAG: NeuD/PglB/VioB family sugar acetyltransferase [Chloroflexota bacterium]|nr:NeuD/PglB/VioB family sugar acetyltransferase [Chloroflexota bacterium]